MEGQLPKLLIVAGVLLQWLRSFKGVAEPYYHVAAVVFSVVAYALVHPFTASGLRAEVVALVVWLPDYLPLVWGGTFVASNAAKMAAVKINASESVFVPLTDSK